MTLLMWGWKHLYESNWKCKIDKVLYLRLLFSTSTLLKTLDCVIICTESCFSFPCFWCWDCECQLFWTMIASEEQTVKGSSECVALENVLMNSRILKKNDFFFHRTLKISFVGFFIQTTMVPIAFSRKTYQLHLNASSTCLFHLQTYISLVFTSTNLCFSISVLQLCSVFFPFWDLLFWLVRTL